jgi:8-hydroxy-5-deazaflavin:NADPH oxidoreductase
MSTRTVGIVGAGNMGRSLVTRLVAAGHTVLVTDHGAEHAQTATSGPDGQPLALARAATLPEVLSAEIVVLALWYPHTVDLATAHRQELTGKIVIDISNPLDDTFTRVDLPGDTSGAERLAAAVPESRVVKAFNTLPAPTLGAGAIDGTPLDCFVASDEPEAKMEVLQLLEGSGLRGLDAGSLDNARVLERLTAFGIELGQRYGLGFDFGFKYLPTEQLTPIVPT